MIDKKKLPQSFEHLHKFQIIFFVLMEDENKLFWAINSVSIKLKRIDLLKFVVEVDIRFK